MQPTHSIWDIRKEYKQESLSENDVNDNAIQQFSAWWNEAIKSKIEEVNAMTLATASCDGLPSARIVLLKEFDEKGFVFYTNYKSFKGQQAMMNISSNSNSTTITITFKNWLQA